MSEDFPTDAVPIQQDGIIHSTDQHMNPEGTVLVAENLGDTALNNTAETTGEAVVSADIPAQEPEVANRWDHDKAETMASVLTSRHEENPVASTAKGSIDDNHAYHENYHYRHQTANRVIYEDAQRRVEENPTEHNLDYLARSKEAYETYTPASEQEIQESRKSSNEALGKQMDHELEPFEMLFDMNPELFANMPTSEFLEKVGQLKNIDSGISISAWPKFQVERILETTEHNLQEKNPRLGEIPYLLDRMKGNIKGVLYERASKEQIDELMKLIDVDEFETSPKQRLEGYKTLLNEVLPLFANELERSNQIKEDFLNQFRPQADKAEGTTHSQAVGNGEFVHTTVDENGQETDIRFPDEHEG